MMGTSQPKIFDIALVSTLEKKIDETEDNFEETNRLSEERLKQALDAKFKIVQLKTTMQRLEEKLSNMESEVRQQSLLNSPIKRMSEHLEIPTTKSSENGHHESEETRANIMVT